MIKHFILTLLPLLALDALWLSTMKPFYAKYLGHLMAETISWGPVAIFYVLYACGIMILVTIPATLGGYSLLKVFLLGALLGLVAYGAYDFTNQATLKDWSSTLTFVDLAWGTLLTGTVSVVSVWLLGMFK